VPHLGEPVGGATVTTSTSTSTSTSTTAASLPSPLSSCVAGLAVVLAATALSGVLSGGRWFGFVVVTVAVVAATGAALRLLRLPPPLVAAGQLAALVCLVTAAFSRSAVLAVLPGPEALRELHEVLSGAADQVRVGVAPVAATTELLCLVVIALGLVTLLVDTLAVSADAPAASGLALLCVVAVPALLAAETLPWWSFALGALGYALLLTVDGRHRHLVWGEAAGPGGQAGGLPGAAAVTVAAVVLSLVASGATGLGSDARLPGTGTSGGAGSSGIGLNPFTSLRGQLDAGTVVSLLRVRGLDERAYLRALTLSRFENGRGWVRGPLDGTATANGPVPLPPGIDAVPPGPVVQVGIEPLHYVDGWLPTVGIPLRFGEVAPDWRYDPAALTAFSGQRQRAEPYTVLAVLPRPDPEQLRADGHPAAGLALPTVGPEYLDTGGVDPRVGQLAQRLTGNAGSAFDATVAIGEFFTAPGSGFRYDLQTAPGSSGDALVDFLFEGRTGYCEQYASAMAIMLRTVGIPARVAIGFTPGTRTGGDTRVVTTEDAHAWVEAFLPGTGWLTFDPTPLADGRGVVPPYVAAADSAPAAALPEPGAAT
jgi:transglutaminase-like putative cysteine protease